MSWIDLESGILTDFVEASRQGRQKRPCIEAVLHQVLLRRIKRTVERRKMIDLENRLRRRRSAYVVPAYQSQKKICGSCGCTVETRTFLERHDEVHVGYRQEDAMRVMRCPDRIAAIRRQSGH